MSKNILVIGKGIVGLVTALALREAGHTVTIRARPSSSSKPRTSMLAGAFWTPSDNIAHRDKLPPRGRQSFDTLARLSEIPESGVRMGKVIGVSKSEVSAPPMAYTTIPCYRPAHADELPEGYLSGHILESAPIISAPQFIMFLDQRVQKVGVEIVHDPVTDLNQPFDGFDTVVSCPGLEARELHNDPDVYPVSGQLVYVNPRQEFNGVLYDADGGRDGTYLIARQGWLVLGGTKYPNDPLPEPDSETTRAIIARCNSIVPGLNVRLSDLMHTTKGQRPARLSGLRLELTRRDDGFPIIPNYGHDGSGFSVPWDCATEVVKMVSAL